MIMEELRIIHTSDVHLGAPFLFLAARGEEQRRALRDALACAVEAAKERRCGALVIAGDLFDAAYDAREADVSFASGCLAAAGPECRVVILPGSHDRFSPGSVFDRELARFEAAGNVHILTPGRPVVDIPELSLAVHGRAAVSSAGSAHALAGLEPLAGRRWNVCVAHGSVEGAGAPLEPREEPIRLSELAPGFDYVALGHWHSFRRVREANPPVVYSGAPEIIARDQLGAGSVVAVSLSPAGARLERIPVGKRRIERIGIDCTGLRTAEELARLIREAAKPDGDLVLEVALSGVIGIDAVLDADRALAELAGDYFSMRLAGPGPSREIPREELLAVPEETVAGRFVRIMLRKIDAAGADRPLFEEALQIGVQLFRGRDPL